jgi:hypothetical protein
MNAVTDNLRSTVLPNSSFALKSHRIAVGGDEARVETPRLRDESDDTTTLPSASLGGRPMERSGPPGWYYVIQFA